MDQSQTRVPCGATYIVQQEMKLLRICLIETLLNILQDSQCLWFYKIHIDVFLQIS